MTDPLFSIVVPCYNAEEYLGTALESLKAQGVTDWEAIVVDDRSVDKTLDCARRASEGDERIRVYALEENKGVAHARNFGLSRTRGVYVGFLDCDDAFDERLFAVLERVVEKERPQMIVWGVCEEYFDASGTAIRERTVVPAPCSCATAAEVRSRIIGLEKQTLFGYAWNKLYRRDLLEAAEAEFPATAINEDVFFNIAVAKRLETMVVVDEALYRYARRDVSEHTSLTGRFLPDYFDLSARRVRGLYDLYRSEGEAGDEVKGVLGAIYLRYALSALQRNCAPEAHMSRSERRAWLDGFYRESLSKELIVFASPEDALARAFAWLFKRGSKTVLLCAARAVHAVSRRFPVLFSRAKQSR